MPIYNGDIIDDYLRFRVDNRKFCWQKGAGRFETLPSIPRSLSRSCIRRIVAFRFGQPFQPSFFVSLSYLSFFARRRHYPCAWTAGRV